MNREILQRRKARNSYRVKANNKSKRPILNVFKSNKNIYAQIIDLDGNVKVYVSTKTKNIADNANGKNGIEKAALVGAELAKVAKQSNITEVVFNKGPYLYSGRVKSLAEAARENGLEF